MAFDSTSAFGNYCTVLKSHHHFFYFNWKAYLHSTKLGDIIIMFTSASNLNIFLDYSSPLRVPHTRYLSLVTNYDNWFSLLSL